MEKQIIIPDGMLSAATAMILKKHGYSSVAAVEVHAYEAHRANCKIALETALLWQTDHPTVPTDEDLDDLWSPELAQMSLREICREAIIRGQRRMFVKREPKVPEEVGDLLYRTRDIATPRMMVTCAEAEERIIEAYRRGKASER